MIKYKVKIKDYLIVGVLYFLLSAAAFWENENALREWNIIAQVAVGVLWISYGSFLSVKGYLVQTGMKLHKNDFSFWTVDLENVVAIEKTWLGRELQTAKKNYRFVTSLLKDDDLKALEIELARLAIKENPFRKNSIKEK